ncbi:MAG: hypothetical protein R3A51_10930 [Nannocystaceae bacterium]|nr:hypothetical protein [Myxococcales bacterium]
MSVLGILLAASATGATYLYAKKKKTSEKTSVALSAATGVMTYIFWPAMLIGGAAIYLGRRYVDRQKALGPGSS